MKTFKWYGVEYVLLPEIDNCDFCDLLRLYPTKMLRCRPGCKIDCSGMDGVLLREGSKNHILYIAQRTKERLGVSDE